MTHSVNGTPNCCMMEEIKNEHRGSFPVPKGPAFVLFLLNFHKDLIKLLNLIYKNITARLRVKIYLIALYNIIKNFPGIRT